MVMMTYKQNGWIMKSLINEIKKAVTQPRYDKMLHFSTDLQNPRHTALAEKHPIPHVIRPWANTLPLLQGTAIHEEVHRIMDRADGWNYVSEQTILVDDVTDFVWSGTVDAYLENPDGEVWLVDYKTISGNSLGFLNDQPKPEHLMQVSAYYHFGVPVPHMRVGILYLPTTPDYRRRWHEPVFMEVKPLDKGNIIQMMTYVCDAIVAYEDDGTLPDILPGTTEWKYNKKEKQWEHWYRPHYSTLFCPWRDEDYDPCCCSNEKPYIMEVSDEAPEAIVE
jgi:hypothetical protein